MNLNAKTAQNVQLFCVLINHENKDSKRCTLFIIILKGVGNIKAKEAAKNIMVEGDFF